MMTTECTYVGRPPYHSALCLSNAERREPTEKDFAGSGWRVPWPSRESPRSVAADRTPSKRGGCVRFPRHACSLTLEHNSYKDESLRRVSDDRIAILEAHVRGLKNHDSLSRSDSDLGVSPVDANRHTRRVLDIHRLNSAPRYRLELNGTMSQDDEGTWIHLFDVSYGVLESTPSAAQSDGHAQTSDSSNVVARVAPQGHPKLEESRFLRASCMHRENLVEGATCKDAFGPDGACGYCHAADTLDALQATLTTVQAERDTLKQQRAEHRCCGLKESAERQTKLEAAESQFQALRAGIEQLMHSWDIRIQHWRGSHPDRDEQSNTVEDCLNELRALLVAPSTEGP